MGEFKLLILLGLVLACFNMNQTIKKSASYADKFNMSGILTSVVAPTASIVASGNQSARADTATHQATNSANAVAVGQAAVVSLSANSKSRGASYGAEKQVDSAFEKQETKKKEESKGNSNKESGQVLNVAA